MRRRLFRGRRVARRAFGRRGVVRRRGRAGRRVDRIGIRF